jgi:large subunit ribosomal protein L23
MANITKSPFSIIREPVITEKAAVAGSESNSYVFSVHPRAKKDEIRAAIEKIFDVSVKSVRTMNVMGKVKRVGQKTGRQKSWKKAYVSLAEGDSIDVIEGL